MFTIRGVQTVLKNVRGHVFINVISTNEYVLCVYIYTYQ